MRQGYTREEKAKKVLWYLFLPEADKKTVHDIQLSHPSFLHWLHDPIVLQAVTQLTDGYYSIKDLGYIRDVRLKENFEQKREKYRNSLVIQKRLF